MPEGREQPHRPVRKREKEFRAAAVRRLRMGAGAVLVADGTAYFLLPLEGLGADRPWLGCGSPESPGPGPPGVRSSEAGGAGGGGAALDMAASWSRADW
ncbi:hypothetical protein [Streptomyces tibetensis]|uniref:hypothetical protein n=1 Tax=Streptomyces tibetensis TaxID=2382123 RepID=UPI0033FF341A